MGGGGCPRIHLSPPPAHRLPFFFFPREGKFGLGWRQRVRLEAPSRGGAAYTEEVSRQAGRRRPGLAPVLLASLSQPKEMSPGSAGTWTVRGEINRECQTP